MKRIYVVRKRLGQWTVWSDEVVCLDFQSYDEAVATARTAARVMLACGLGVMRKDDALSELG